MQAPDNDEHQESECNHNDFVYNDISDDLNDLMEELSIEDKEVPLESKYYQTWKSNSGIKILKRHAVFREFEKGGLGLLIILMHR